MRPTDEELQSYVGGQMRISNSLNGPLFLGEIKTISIGANELLVAEFNWAAKGEGDNPLSIKWKKADLNSHTIKLNYCLIGTENSGEEENLIFNNEVIGEVVRLFPPNGCRVSPTMVEGLNPTRPFHETIVDSITQASSPEEMILLAKIIRETKIPKNYSNIIKAWNIRTSELSCLDHGVTDAVLRQKQAHDGK